MILDAYTVKEYITANMLCDHIDVDGDGHHFYVTIVSPLFEGKNRLERHRLVYEALGDRMREEIHALSMKTVSTNEWNS